MLFQASGYKDITAALQCIQARKKRPLFIFPSPQRFQSLQFFSQTFHSFQDCFLNASQNGGHSIIINIKDVDKGLKLRILKHYCKKYFEFVLQLGKSSVFLFSPLSLCFDQALLHLMVLPCFSKSIKTIDLYLNMPGKEHTKKIKVIFAHLKARQVTPELPHIALLPRKSIQLSFCSPASCTLQQCEYFYRCYSPMTTERLGSKQIRGGYFCS